MHARLTLTMGDRRVVATLDADGQWACEDLLIESFLNSAFSPEYAEPQSMPTSTVQLVQKAATVVQDAGWGVHYEILQADQNAA